MLWRVYWFILKVRIAQRRKDGGKEREKWEGGYVHFFTSRRLQQGVLREAKARRQEFHSPKPQAYLLHGPCYWQATESKVKNLGSVPIPLHGVLASKATAFPTHHDVGHHFEQRFVCFVFNVIISCHMNLDKGIGRGQQISFNLISHRVLLSYNEKRKSLACL